MSACPELSPTYHQQYYTTDNSINNISKYHPYRSYNPGKSSFTSGNLYKHSTIDNNPKHHPSFNMNNTNYDQRQNKKNQKVHSPPVLKNNRSHRMSRKLSPPLSVTSSSSSNSTTTSNTNNSGASASSNKSPSLWNFTWLVFMNEKWVPFDVINQVKLEQTLTVGGTFVDIVDSHFPDVKRVRVFPRNNYLSYLGVKYRLSRIMQPDAYLDHVGIAQTKKRPTTPTSPPLTFSLSDDENDNLKANGSNRSRIWEL